MNKQRRYIETMKTKQKNNKTLNIETIKADFSY